MHAVDAEKPNPILAIETRPSNVTGHAWFMVLTYKEHTFEEMIPFDFPSLDEVGQQCVTQAAAEKLRAKLAPILMKEDGEVERPKLFLA